MCQAYRAIMGPEASARASSAAAMRAARVAARVVARAAASALRGILLGVKADDELSASELLFLDAWIRAQRHLRGGDIVDLLDLVTELFAEELGDHVAPERTREELLHEAGQVTVKHRPEELHLLDPDEPGDAAVLRDAMGDPDARVRRMAVAGSSEPAAFQRSAPYSAFRSSKTAVDM